MSNVFFYPSLFAITHQCISSVDDGIGFSLLTHPVCLPFESKNDPNRWKDRKVEVVGYATKDFSGSKGDVMKAAHMTVFTQSKCNNKLDDKLTKNKNCKYISLILDRNIVVV